MVAVATTRATTAMAMTTMVAMATKVSFQISAVGDGI